MPPSTETSSSWDFTPVIDLLHTFSTDSQIPPRDANTRLSPAEHGVKDASKLENGDAVHDAGTDPELGDFSTLWNFLARSSLSDAEQPAPTSASRGAYCLNSGTFKKPSFKDGQYGSTDKSPEADGDGLTVAPAKRNGKAGKSIPHTSSLIQEQSSKQPDATSVISITSSIQIPNAENHDLSEASDPFVDSPPLRPMKILARPKPQQPKASTIESKDGALLKPPGTDSNIHSAPRKRPQTPPKSRSRNRPAVTEEVTYKRSRLVQKLIENYPERKKSLLNSDRLLPTYSAQNAPPSSIHVFVDASNIMIGFHDCIKISRDIPVTTRIPRVPLSFSNFSLVLERNRPTAKRVLVGSDRFPAIQEAEHIGYEANILDRVHKSKEFTPGRKKSRDGKNGHRNGNGNHSGHDPSGHTSSGSETNAAPAPEKWVEQAVDEILHLKILESIVDTEKPSTMVLATGDAAEAEYSGGFMKMVTRALQKGWTIELVSFSMNTSATYKRRDFRSKWGSKFKMIQLDGYIEELIDT